MAVVAGMGCGTWGYLIYGHEHGGQGSVLSAVYHALQLFLLHMPHLEGRINWPLEIGRWSAALATGLTGLLFLHSVMLFEWRHLWVKLFISEHVVVCGLGATGTRIVEALTRQKTEAGSGLAAWLRRLVKALLATFIRKNRPLRVVAIERDHRMPGVAAATRLGIPVVIGDARDPAVLRKARVHRAKHILAVCTEDDTNVAVAVAVRDLGKRERRAPKDAKCLLLLEDPELRAKLALPLGEVPPPGGFRIRVGGLDVPDVIARNVFRAHPLDFDGIGPESPARVHLVVMGTCALAEALAVKALQLGHFANQTKAIAPTTFVHEHPLRLTVVGDHAAEMIARLRDRHRHAKPWYEAVAVPGNGTRELPAAVLDEISPDDFLTVVVCPGSVQSDDAKAENQSVLRALAVAKQLNSLGDKPARSARRQVLVRLRQRTGFAALFDGMGPTPVCAFGETAALCSAEMLLDEEQDKLAQVLHQEYLDGQKKKRENARADGRVFEMTPTFMPWELLTEFYRDSNRLLADHLDVKLRALGYLIKRHGEKGELATFADPKDALAIAEHSRWCATYWLDGWRYDPVRNDDDKAHPSLRSWEELPEDMRYIDQQFVTHTVDVLHQVEQGVYPADGTPERAR